MKKLEELRVVDLRAELDKRGLDKSGIKAVLLERLKKSIQSAGEDPEEYDLCNINQSRISNNDEQDSLNEDVSVMDITEESLSADGGTESVANRKSLTKCSPKKQTLKEDGGEEEEKEEVEEESTQQHDSENGNDPPSNEDVNMCEEEMNGTASKEKEDPNENIVGMEEEEEDEEEEEEEEEGRGNGLTREEYARHIEIDSINLMIEDDDKMLDYEENDRTDMEELSNADGKDKEDGNNDIAGNSSESSSKQDSSGQFTDKNESDNTKSAKDTDPNAAKDEKKDKNQGTASSSRNLWVSGLASNTRAQDLKSLFSKHGKVLSAKIVTNAKTPGAKCYGFVTMSTLEDANKCISHLNRTELHGRMIQVEKAKGEPGGPKPPSTASKSSVQGSKEVLASDKKEGEKGREPARRDSQRKDGDAKGKERRKSLPEQERGRERSKSALHTRLASKSSDRERERRGGKTNDARSRLSRPSAKDRVVDRRHEISKRKSFPTTPNPTGVPPAPRNKRSPRRNMLSFNRIVQERERQRLRTRERLMREEERMRRDEEMHLRTLEKRQKEEAERLHREREKLRIEREKIERQKQDLLRLERETQRLEREKLERERDELRKQQIKYEEVRRGVKRPAPPSDRDRRDYFDDRKRVPDRGVPDRGLPNRGPDRMPERGGPDRNIQRVPDRGNMLRGSDRGGGGSVRVPDRVPDRGPARGPDRGGSDRGRFNDDARDSRYERHGADRGGPPMRGNNQYEREREDRRPMDRAGPRGGEGRDHRGPPPPASMRDRPPRDNHYNGGSMINVPLDTWRGTGNSTHAPKNGGPGYGSANSNLLGGGVSSVPIPGRGVDGQASWRPSASLSTNERWGGNSGMGGGRNNSMMDILRDTDSYIGGGGPVPINTVPLMSNMNQTDRFGSMANFRK